MYEAFYNLSARPFQLIPDPRLLFESRNHKRALSYLLYGLERREGLVVITGDVGMGKTLLVQTLLAELQPRNLSIARVAMANLDAESVLQSVASAFGLRHKSRSKIELLDDLVAKLLPSQNRGALLIVDEAQTCTPQALEELRAISNLQAGGRALLQVFLVGQTDLRNTLAHPNMAHMRQRIVAAHHLRPLDLDEMSNYIKHRLRAVGWRANPRFEADVFEVAHEWSKGVPRRINTLMDRFLMYGFLEQLKVLSGKDLRNVIAEFEDDFTDDPFVFGTSNLASPDSLPAANGSQAMDGAGATSGKLGGLNTRVHALERALFSAFGPERARQLMEKHQVQVDNKELLAAQMRVARLESVFAEALASQQRQGAQETQDADAEARSVAHEVPDADDESAAEQPAEANVAQADEKADENDRVAEARVPGRTRSAPVYDEFEPAYEDEAEPADDESEEERTTDDSRRLADIDSITPARSYDSPDEAEDPDEDPSGWRLFARRRRG